MMKRLFISTGVMILLLLLQCTHYIGPIDIIPQLTGLNMIIKPQVISLNANALRPAKLAMSQKRLKKLRSDLRSEQRSKDNFDVNLRRARKELSMYTLLLAKNELKSPEQGEKVWDRVFDLRLHWNSIDFHDYEYSRWREVKDGIISMLMQLARAVLELDRFGSWNYEPWEMLASARRYAVKLRAVPLKEITNRQLLEDMLDGLDEATDFIGGVPVEGYRDEIGFVWGHIQSTHDNIIARIQELEQQRSEIRKSA